MKKKRAKNTLIYCGISLLLASQSDAAISLKETLLKRIRPKLPPNTKILLDNITLNNPSDMKISLIQDSITHLYPEMPVGLISFSYHTKRHSGYGTAQVKAFSQVAVTKRSLPQGSKLSEENIMIKKIELTPYLNQDECFEKTQGLIGAKTLVFLPAGATIKTTMVILPSMISKGEIVEANYQYKSLHITARMRALEDGNLGDWVKVENLDSHHLLNAKVMGKESVIIQ